MHHERRFHRRDVTGASTGPTSTSAPAFRPWNGGDRNARSVS